MDGMGLLIQGELHLDRLLHLAHVRAGQLTDQIKQPGLADCGELVGHRLALLAVDRHIGLAGIEAVGFACQRHHLHPVEEFAGRFF